MKDRNAKGTNEDNEVQQHMKSLKARDCEGIDEVNELKRELKELKVSLKLKCIAPFYVIVCFAIFVAIKFM